MQFNHIIKNEYYMIKFIRSFIGICVQTHNFFIKESSSIIGEDQNPSSYYRLVMNRLYYPFAYLFFMYLSIRDWLYEYKI